MTKLIELNLANNVLSDSLNHIFGNMKNLSSLYLQNNKFYGELPPSIGNLTNLEFLDVSNNELIGEIPHQLCACSKLISLNFNTNYFSGNIPSQLGMLDQLIYFDLSNNYLSGCMASEFLIWCSPKIVNDVEVFRNINLTDNNLLPWLGDFEMFCSNSQNQIGAPCDNCVSSDGMDVIQADCTCGINQNKPGSISGTVYNDLNSSGSYDDFDTNLNDVTVYLLHGCPGISLYSTTKTVNGLFTFTNLPVGNYTVLIPDLDGPPDGVFYPDKCCFSVKPCQPENLICDFGYPPPDCTSNPYSVDNLCEMAYSNPLCDVSVIGEWACGQNPSEVGPWVGKKHCGGTYENTTFYGFVAGSGAYQFQFTIFSCAGTGVEYGLMEACNPDGPFVVCNASSNTGTVTIDASQLEPCKPYIFWIDGFQGSICSYYVEVQGDVKPCYISPIQDIVINQECNLLCPNLGTLPVTIVGTQGDLNIDDIDNLTLQWDISFNGGPYIKTTSTPSTDGVTIDVPFLQAGTYKICVETEYYCTKNLFPFCKTFEFQSPNITSKEYNLCIDDFPWNGEVDSLTGLAVLDEYGNPWKWSGGPIELSNINTTPPTYSFSSNYVDTCGCTYIQNIKFNILSSSQQRYDVCYKDLPFSIGDTLINNEVTSLPIYINNSQDTLSCDSIIYLSLQIFSEGEPCDDKDASTINDVYDAACVCKGEKSNKVVNTAKDAWSIYPNPVTETLIISNSSAQFAIPDIEIYNIQGIFIKPIIKENIGLQPKLELETTALPPGVYHLKIKTNQDMTIKRFVKI
jgi:Leucine-rich repeat (LRR) protein